VDARVFGWSRMRGVYARNGLGRAHVIARCIRNGGLRRDLLLFAAGIAHPDDAQDEARAFRFGRRRRKQDIGQAVGCLMRYASRDGLRNLAAMSSGRVHVVGHDLLVLSLW
jgi:hypothetical protein